MISPLRGIIPSFRTKFVVVSDFLILLYKLRCPAFSRSHLLNSTQSPSTSCLRPLCISKWTISSLTPLFSTTTFSATFSRAHFLWLPGLIIGFLMTCQYFFMQLPYTLPWLTGKPPFHWGIWRLCSPLPLEEKHQFWSRTSLSKWY